MSEVINSSSDSSQQLSKLNDALRAKERECEELQSSAAEASRQADSCVQKLQLELQAAVDKAKVTEAVYYSCKD